MSRAPAAPANSQPLIPSNRDEALIREISQYRFLTAKDLCALLYSKGSLTFVRERCTRLAGNTDYATGYPLYRFPFPSAQGNRERIYTLGSLGREMLENLGLEIHWHFNLAKFRTFSRSTLLHDLTRNRFVVSLLAWAKTKPNLSIEPLLSYELAKPLIPIEIPVQGKLVQVRVVPDALIHITNTRSGHRLALLLEVDQNTQAESRFKRHIASRLSFVKSPQFTFAYRDIPYRIVYATQAITDAAAQARLRSMCKFTMDVLTERQRQQDSRYFRFTTINFSTLYQDALFEQAVWYRPDDLKLQSPLPLLTD